MSDFVIGNETLVNNTGDVVIPEGVTTITKDFSECKMTSVTIPNSVTNIEKNPFYQCEALRNIIVNPNHPTLETIDGMLFYKPEKRLVCCPVGLEMKTYTIPQGVKSIEADAFHNCRSLKSITLPDGVTSIGKYAFEGCRELERVMLPKSVTSIEEGAFNYCTKLMSITLPESLTSIGEDAFKDCLSMESITLPDGLLEIPDHVFSGCYGLTSIVIPDSVTSIGEYVFHDCVKLETVVLPKGIRYISNGMFSGINIRGCKALKTIVLPDTIESIGSNVFSLSGLTSIIVPEKVTSIGRYAFAYCYELASVTVLGDHCDFHCDFGEYPFWKCINIKKVRFPNLRGFDRNLFNGCMKIESIVAPNVSLSLYDANVKRALCVGFAIAAEEEADIAPEKKEEYVKYISNQRKRLYPRAIEEHALLRFMTREGIIPKSEIDSVLTLAQEKNDVESAALLLQYAGELNASGESTKKLKGKTKKQEEGAEPGILTVSKAKALWNFKPVAEGICITGYKGMEADVSIPSMIGTDQVVEIEDAFNAYRRKISDQLKAHLHSSLRNVVIPEGVKSIGTEAFHGCEGLESVKIPNSVTSIGKKAFSYCSKLKSIDIPNNVTNIGGEAFAKCEHIDHITIPKNVKNVGDDAFRSCSKLASLCILSNSVNITGRSFPSCNELAEITVGPDATAYRAEGNCLIQGNSVVLGCKNSVIPDGVERICEKAFISCTELKDITIPDSVVSIEGAFMFSGLTSIVIPNGVTNIDEAFYACSKLNSVVIPKSVTSIGKNTTEFGLGTFESCESLTSVNIPDSVVCIGRHAFNGCKSLTSVIIPASVVCIGLYAFGWCEKLASVTIPESVESIGKNAFSGCTSLPFVIIPDSVKNIEADAFDYCPKIKIHAHEGSYAAQFANEHGIPLEIIK